MAFRSKRNIGKPFVRLARDTGGNTLAMMAAALIPMSAMAGSAIDMARLYVVKVRLQQACDSGALAGRKFMDDSNTSSTLDSTATTRAQQFFTNNFEAGWFKTTAVSFTPSKTADSQVSAVATATVPMTIMKMFGKDPVQLNVACEARFDVPDVDIMFVLDTTGSMACAAADVSCSQPNATYTRADGTTGYYVTEKSDAKIKALRAGVLNFYDTMTNNSDPATNLRYGFVPYTSTVNVGYLLPSSSLVNDTWSYQSRRVIGDSNSGLPTTSDVTTDAATCNAYAGRSPASGYDTSGNAVVTTVAHRTSDNRCLRTSQTVIPLWRYGPWDTDISQYVTGAFTADPTKIDGSTTRWQGCIEERDTRPSASFNVQSLPEDLDPDLAATSRATRWRPMWGETIYYRGTGTQSVDSPGNYPNIGMAPYAPYGYVSCGKQAQRLAVTTRAEINAYLNAADFVPLGGTYHDVGMIWGTRLISPTGLFASDTAAWPNRNAPNRNIIFMTDGQMAPALDIYGLYGMERYDRRVAASASSQQRNRHNTRFVAECEAARARNITVWVIGFGAGGSMTPEMQNCASPGRAYYATDDAALTAAFANIASQIASLRLSR